MWNCKLHIVYLSLFLLLAGGQAFALIYPDDFRNGWAQYVGKTITFNQRMYLCARHPKYANRMYVGHKRLRAAEECGTDESKDLIYIIDNNTTDFKLPSGAYVDNLTAYVNSERSISVTGQINWHYDDMQIPPDVGGRLKVVTANIQKYIYNWEKSSFAECKSNKEFNNQTNKIVAGLLAMNADIYAIQEIEETSDAIECLVDAMNTEFGANVYEFVADSWNNYNYTKSAYIYRRDKLNLIGGNMSGTASNDYVYVYRMRIQCFQEKLTGEKFLLSVNHFRSKSSDDDTDKTRMENVRNLINRLKNNDFGDEDVLIVGDLNSYTNEQPCRYLVSNGYIDQMMKYAPDGYSYCFNSLVGYLDHAFANQSMSNQITGAAPFHVNADYSSVYYDFKSGNTTMHRYSDHDPLIIGINLHVKGDTNCDGTVNVNDITTIAEYILNGETDSLNERNVDVNGDGIINVNDITDIAAIILESKTRTVE